MWPTVRQSQLFAPIDSHVISDQDSRLSTTHNPFLTRRGVHIFRTTDIKTTSLCSSESLDAHSVIRCLIAITVLAQRQLVQSLVSAEIPTPSAVRAGF